MRFIPMLIISAALFFPTSLSAKRIAPKEVKSIVLNGVEYSAPHDQMGFIIAKDVKSQEIIWSKQIYTIRYDVKLERDVQDVFITKIKAGKDHSLVIKNEDGERYKLELRGLNVSLLALK